MAAKPHRSPGLRMEKLPSRGTGRNITQQHTFTELVNHATETGAGHSLCWFLDVRVKHILSAPSITPVLLRFRTVG